MRIWLVAALAATSLGLLAAPAALADAGPAGITVNGIGRMTIDAGAKPDAIRAAYRTAVGAAIDDAKDEAAFLAGRAGLKAGAITALVEQSSPPLDGCAVYVYDKVVSAPSSSRPTSTTSKPKPKHKHKKKHAAKKARRAHRATAIAEPQPAPQTCNVDAAVSVTFSIAP